jgi:hypothetical protein
MSPARSAIVQVGYRAVYGTLQILAVVGLWRTRHAWREHLLVWLVLLGFVATTAVLWAHTSHRSLLDVIVCVYAAGAACGINGFRRVPASQRSGYVWDH